ncbi:MAG: hypothetical protein R3B72_00030 [Polyangiaceae bacterium]
MRRARFFSIAILLAACGGTAVIDGDPIGTGGASTTPPSPGPGPGPKPDPRVDAACQSICDHAADNGCPQTNCAAHCQELAQAGGTCEGTLLALLDCWSGNLAPGLCQPPAACQDEQLAYLGCSAPALDYNGCPNASAEGHLPTGGCSSFACSFDGAVHTQSCWCDGGSTCLCECVREGELVGTCEEYVDGADVSCYAFAACCEFVFDEGG